MPEGIATISRRHSTSNYDYAQKRTGGSVEFERTGEVQRWKQCSFKGMAKNPDDRFLDANEMLDCLASGENIQEKRISKPAAQIEETEHTPEVSSTVNKTDSQTPAKVPFWLSPTGVFVIIAIICTVIFLMQLKKHLAAD